MKIALITGITGQDGSYLAEFLLEKGYDVHGMIRRNSSDYRERIAHLEGIKNFHLHFGHMGDSMSILQIIQKVHPGGAIPSLGEIRNCHINVGTGKELTIRELSDLVVKAVGFQGTVEFDASKPDGTMRKLIDVSKLHSLGWTHKIEIEEGVRKLFKWYQDSLEIE